MQPIGCPRALNGIGGAASAVPCPSPRRVVIRRIPLPWWIMIIRTLCRRATPLVIVALLLIAPARPAAAQADTSLAGVWEAKRRFGPDVRGTLLVRQVPGGWRAEIAGHAAQPRTTDSTIAFELPGGRGAFRGRFAAGGERIVGQWIQPRTVNAGTPYASPLELVRAGSLWRGEVVPLDDDFTFYLVVRPRADGSLGAFLRNPERNLGRQQRVSRVEREGEAVRLVGTRGGSAEEQVLAEGTLREGRLAMDFPFRGGGYDFRRLSPDEPSDFHPRGRPDAGYAYLPPPDLGDGWRTGSLEEAGISRDGIERWMRTVIQTPDDSVSTPRMHGVIIARRGRLVLEEYFHGEHRDRPHDTRSAAKALTSTLAGAAVHAGAPLRLDSPIYAVMNGGALPDGLEPRKRAITLEHLLTMTSGLDCDDSNPESRGNEETLTSQDEDYYRYTLALSTVRDPGQQAVYCSGQPNLAGGVVSRAAGRPLPELMHELLGGPLQMGRYYLPLTPTGDAYGGGGVRFTLRDFARIGEMYLREGSWNGRQVLSPEWVRRSTSPLHAMGTLRYGFYWYVIEYPHRGRTLRAFYAGGNGGQTLMVIPELDMVIAIFAGNYADNVRTFAYQRTVVPRDILPAVDADR
jgi:CubicO group peptidase (beta-lactamase class C family)